MEKEPYKTIRVTSAIPFDLRFIDDSLFFFFLIDEQAPTCRVAQAVRVWYLIAERATA